MKCRAGMVDRQYKIQMFSDTYIDIIYFVIYLLYLDASGGR
jgi:hypothetical protein